jgi:hypothetical protein
LTALTDCKFVLCHCGKNYCSNSSSVGNEIINNFGLIFFLLFSAENLISFKSPLIVVCLKYNLKFLQISVLLGSAMQEKCAAERTQKRGDVFPCGSMDLPVIKKYTFPIKAYLSLSRWLLSNFSSALNGTSASAAHKIQSGEPGEREAVCRA